MPTVIIRQVSGNYSTNKKITGVAGQSLGFDSAGNITSLNPSEKVTDYTADGAITIHDGVATLSKGSAAAMTLDAPTTAQAGTELTIIASTPHAHTVTLTAGFNGAGAGADVATFGGAAGDNISLIASGTNWLVKSLRNVTLG